MRRLLPIVLAALVGAAAAAPARSQDRYTYSFGLLGGVGGSFDAEPGESFDHTALELNVGVVTHDRTLTVVRVASLDLGDDLAGEGLLDAELRFVTVAGEYRFRQPSYDFGIYLGLGGYQLAGDQPGVGGVEETALGIAFGLTGDFDVTRHVSVVGEFAAHYAFLDRADLYGLALGGLAVHF